MMDSLLTEALINREYRVLGRKLRPYCLWHEFLLLASENPLFCESGEEINITHLEAAVRICQCRFGELPGTRMSGFWVGMKAVFLGLDRQLERFRTYISDYNSGPQVWQKESVSSKGGPPGTIYTVTQCLSLGIGEERAWEMPIGLALWYSSTRQFDKGTEMDFVTERNRRMMEQLKETLKNGQDPNNGSEG